MPSAAARSYTVATGWNVSGSASSSRQSRQLSSRPVSGTATWRPSSPCAPGGAPVPSEARLVTVVAGNPDVIGPPSIAFRNGASSGWAFSCSQPRPSITRTQARGSGGRSRTLAASGTPSAASTEEGRSASAPAP